jgi:hypothetical protein
MSDVSILRQTLVGFAALALPIPISIADGRHVNERARSTSANISSVELVDCSIVLDLTQPFV